MCFSYIHAFSIRVFAYGSDAMDYPKQIGVYDRTETETGTGTGDPGGR